jgi:Rrf2 family protein
MRLSKRCEYGLRALIDLGLCAELGTPRVGVRALAAHEGLPTPFLAQILGQLAEAGYVRGKRGKGGGYGLARAMEEVRLGDVVRLFEGPLAPIRCVSRSAYEPCSCPDEDHCGLRLLMTDVHNAVAGILDRYHLADIVRITLRKMLRDGVAFPLAGDSTGSAP